MNDDATQVELGSLRSTFSNFPRRTTTLVERWNRGVYGGVRRASTLPVQTDRGPLVRRIGSAQTFLTPAEVDRLVADYDAGLSVRGLAKKYGIHRGTVSAHLRRRNVALHRPGLGVDDRAEAVRLFRAGVSMRAIARRLGVGRSPVRAALDEAGVLVSEQPTSEAVSEPGGQDAGLEAVS